VVPNVCSANPNGSANSSRGIREYVSVMATLILTYFLMKVIMPFVKNNCETSLIGDMLNSYFR